MYDNQHQKPGVRNYEQEFPGRKKLELENSVKRGANWFYWIAALSVVNSILIMTGTELNFVVGLGITQVVDGFALGMAESLGSSSAVYFAFAVNLGITGIFAMFGYFAKQNKGWGFGVGMGLFAVDTILFILVMDFIGIAFHAFALYSIYTGYKAFKELSEMPRQVRQPQQQQQYVGRPM